MRSRAVNDFHDLLSNRDLVRDSIAELEARMRDARLIFGGRPLCPYLRPHLVLESDWKRVSQIGEVIFSALQRVNDAAVSSPELLDGLGMKEIEKELISVDPGYRQVAPTARLDSFLTKDTYSYVELNGESPAGIAYSDSARDIFRELPVVKEFAKKYDLVGLEGRTRLLDTLVKCYAEYSGEESPKPVIGIVDLKGLPTHSEFELCRDFFESRGYRSVICSPDELAFRDNGLFFGKIKIDLVYRRLLVNEYIPFIEKHPALVDAYRARAVCIANSFRSKLVHKKAVFAILTDARYRDLFDKTQLEVIRETVPWTRVFEDSLTEYGDERISLIEWTRKHRTRLTLKPNDDYGGQGIYIGWTMSPSEWDDAIDAVLKRGGYIVQERVKTAKEVFPYIDEVHKVRMMDSLVDLDPLLFDGKVGSAITRLSTTELANVTSGGGMVPTFLVRDDTAGL